MASFCRRVPDAIHLVLARHEPMSTTGTAILGITPQKRTTDITRGGHEGIIVVHKDGSATYARFGPPMRAVQPIKAKSLSSR